jgi:hypothetical protein
MIIFFSENVAQTFNLTFSRPMSVCQPLVSVILAWSYFYLVSTENSGQLDTRLWVLDVVIIFQGVTSEIFSLFKYNFH